ncbi:hypothetical protein ACFSR7_04600 [Cohnella sp. GCM10020058]|uniref:hypothetical protein n=1 Tax=Cohnella sp. GCM10020058 TaxID=3317330 RepID=UPI00364302D4
MTSKEATINVSIKAAGYLGSRSALSYDRLEQEEYRPATIFKKAYSWPGDWEGRIMLALAMLERATGRQPLYLEEMLDAVGGHLNDKGYFGNMYPAGELDEQQLSGHSWFLRAMCEIYETNGDGRALHHIQNIVRELLLPAAGYYRTYPVERNGRILEGEAIGEPTGERIGNWYPSTDVGCAFILLDGATHAYRVLRWPELRELIDEMVDVFQTIDWTGQSFQTHATLSAARGILRHYESTEEPALLRLALRIYGLYVREGMTENYANYNWFGRPEWTEPCAVVDSFLLAKALWKHTGKLRYLEDAQSILYNGLSYGQRPNGGFGCDCCAGAKDAYLSPRRDLFEAYWCCSMRGGDGLAQAVLSLYAAEDRTVTLPFYNDSAFSADWADGGRLSLEQKTAYPFEGNVRLRVNEACGAAAVRLRLYVPSWCGEREAELLLNGKPVAYSIANGFAELERVWLAGDTIEFRFPVTLRAEAPRNDRHDGYGQVIRHGVLVLGAAGGGAQAHLAALRPIGPAVYKSEEDGAVFAPLTELTGMSESDAMENRRRVLFELHA